MASLIALFSGVYAKVILLATKLLGICGTFFAGIFTKLGLKLLSVEWIKKVVDVVKKVWAFLKKIIFNEKVVRILKYLLAIAMCALALVQVFYIGRAVYANFDGILELFKTSKISAILFSASVVIGVVATTILCFKSVFALFKKQFNLTFVPVLLFTCLLLIFLRDVILDGYVFSIVESVKFIDILVIITLVFAFINFFDKRYPVSFFGIIFAAVGILIIFLIFKGAKIGAFLGFEMSGEIAPFTSKDVGLINAIQGWFTPTEASGRMRFIANYSMTFANDSGSFVAGLVLTLSSFVIIINSLLPYVLLSCAIGLLMGLINDRQKQYAYFTKVLKTLGYALLSVVLALVLALILTLAFSAPEGVVFTISSKVGPMIGAMAIFLALIIIVAIARTLFARKLYGKHSAKTTK